MVERVVVSYHVGEQGMMGVWDPALLDHNLLSFLIKFCISNQSTREGFSSSIKCSNAVPKEDNSLITVMIRLPQHLEALKSI